MKVIISTSFILLLYIAVFSQNKLDSLYYSKEPKHEDTTNTYKEPKSKFLYTLRTLFGIGVQSTYAYQTGSQKYFFNDIEGLLPTTKYNFHEGMLRVDLSTPIINIFHTWTFNSFSNENLNNYRYSTTHINFFAASRLEMFLKKSKQPSPKGILLSWLLPFFDRKNISSDTYKENDIRVGSIYNFIAYQRNRKQIKNIQYDFNNQTYIGNLDVTYNRFYFLDLRGFRDFLTLANYDFHKLQIQLGNDSKIQGLGIISYIPFPFANLYVPWGKFSIKDESGVKLNSGKLSKGLGVSLGVAYTPPIFIKKINAIIIPELMWQFFDYSGAVSANDPSNNQSQQQVFDFANLRHRYIYAGIGMQFFL
jgi:hypothetical protein